MYYKMCNKSKNKKLAFWNLQFSQAER